MGGGQPLFTQDMLKTVVAVTCAVLFVTTAIALIRNEFSRHWLVRSTIRLAVKLYCRAKHEGREHVPRQGPLIVASNHVSWLDPAFLGAAIPRLIHFVAAREYYELWYLNWLMRLFGTIPLERGKGQREPFKRAVAALQQGRVVGMFPEGRMTLDGNFQPLQGGTALLAAETQSPVLPVAIIGGYEVMGAHLLVPRPHKVRVRIGAPIDPRGLDRNAILTRLDAAIRDLLRQGK